MNGELLGVESTASAKPVDLLVVFHHYNAVGITSCNLDNFFVVLFVNLEISWTQLRVEMVVAKLTLVTRAPGINFPEARFSDCMSVAALDGVDSFTNILEALDELWILSWVGMTKSKLAVRVVLSKGIHEALLADEEAKVASASYFLDLGLLTEWHPRRQALFHAVLSERPSECISIF